VSEVDGSIVGYFSIVELKDDLDFSGVIIKKGFWLEHIAAVVWLTGGPAKDSSVSRHSMVSILDAPKGGGGN